jgi:hypothetical protein
MKINPDDNYLRVDDYANRVDNLEFSGQIWAIFAKLDQARSSVEIASSLQISTETVQAAFNRLYRSKLIYLAESKKTVPTIRGIEPPPNNVNLVEKPTNPVVKNSLSLIFLQLVSDKPLNIQPPPHVFLRLGGNSAPVSTKDKVWDRPWKLRPILNAISVHAGGGRAGQMLVYKILLQVPADLLKEVGLESINHVDDNFTVNNFRFSKALSDSVLRNANMAISSFISP